MLKIFNNMQPFFEDNYRELHVRAYAKKQNISPPTASKLLEHLTKEHLLNKTTDKGYNLFAADRQNPIFRRLQITYYEQRLQPLIEYINDFSVDPLLILFGSAQKCEITDHSDIDLALFSRKAIAIDVKPYETQLKREIQLFRFKDMQEAPKLLLGNIQNGIVLLGSW